MIVSRDIFPEMEDFMKARFENGALNVNINFGFSINPKAILRAALGLLRFLLILLGNILAITAWGLVHGAKALWRFSSTMRTALAELFLTGCRKAVDGWRFLHGKAVWLLVRLFCEAANLVYLLTEGWKHYYPSAKEKVTYRAELVSEQASVSRAWCKDVMDGAASRTLPMVHGIGGKAALARDSFLKAFDNAPANIHSAFESVKTAVTPFKTANASKMPAVKD